MSQSESEDSTDRGPWWEGLIWGLLSLKPVKQEGWGVWCFRLNLTAGGSQQPAGAFGKPWIVLWWLQPFW